MTNSLTPQQDTSSFFELQDVTIGINFHWERKEVQRFKGELKIIVEDDRLTAINIIPIEDYLTSVISSEMSATASLELLKAHAYFPFPRIGIVALRHFHNIIVNSCFFATFDNSFHTYRFFSAGNIPRNRL